MKNELTNKADVVTNIDTFGAARKLMLQTMIQLRDGDIDVNRGMAIAAGMKVINDNVQCEINAAKLALLAQREGYRFGAVVEMGKTAICR